MNIPTELLRAATRVVFVGPSFPIRMIPQRTGRLVLDPVTRGDVDAVVAACPALESIGIIDGKFMNSFSISPKEILRAMDAGKKAYGASSMGALRATELAVYGMIGVGEIYTLYASRTIDADDEVAMTFDAETLMATSEPMVNIRITLDRACRDGRIDPSVAEIALKAIKQIYYPSRTYKALLHAVEGDLSAADYSALRLVCERPVNAKEDDAGLLLDLMEKNAISTSTDLVLQS